MYTFNRQFISDRLVIRDAFSRSSLAVFTVRLGSSTSYSEREYRHALRVMALMKRIDFTHPFSASDILERIGHGKVDYVYTAVSRSDLLKLLSHICFSNRSV
jgi:hypothetical protein